MAYQHLLLASGGAEHSRLAERRAVDLARALSAKLSLVSVVRNKPLPGVGAGFDMALPVTHPDLFDQQREQQQEILAEACARCEGYGLRPETVLRSGDAGRQIVELAQELSCDLMVVGSRQLSIMSTITLGSVSDYVMRHAHCDVLIAVNQS